jgi:hypothetical protein
VDLIATVARGIASLAATGVLTMHGLPVPGAASCHGGDMPMPPGAAAPAHAGEHAHPAAAPRHEPAEAHTCVAVAPRPVSVPHPRASNGPSPALAALSPASPPVPAPSAAAARAGPDLARLCVLRE